MKIWRDELLLPYIVMITRAILDEINRERKGEIISKSRLRAVINSFAEVHDILIIYECMRDKVDLSELPRCELFLGPKKRYGEVPLYVKYFEMALMYETTAFYEKASHSYLIEHTVEDYLIWVISTNQFTLLPVMGCIKSEKKRAASYLSQTTWKPLLGAIYDGLIGIHFEKIAAEFPHLMKENRKAALNAMYKLLFQYHGGVSQLADMLETFVTEWGTMVLAHTKPMPMAFMIAVLKILKTGENILQNAFDNDRALKRAFERGVRNFVNHNALTINYGGSQIVPELIAKCADFILRKDSKSRLKNEPEDWMDAMLRVFWFLEDKDEFRKFYLLYLSRRLIYDNSISYAAEYTMVNKMNEYCGNDYTIRFRSILKDVNRSQSLMKEFNEWNPFEPIGVNISIMVLSSGIWNYESQNDVVLPPELEQYISCFEEFFTSKHSRCTLAWCYHLSRAELTSVDDNICTRLIVSTYQMVILLLFNKADRFSVRQIKNATSIEEDKLIQILQYLINEGILNVVGREENAGKQSPKPQKRKLVDYPPEAHTQQLNNEEVSSQQEDPNITLDTTLTLRLKHRLHNVCIRLDVPLGKVTKKEMEKSIQEAEKDRRHCIQVRRYASACVIRILKVRNRLEHEELVKKALDQLSSRFTPEIGQIKVRSYAYVRKGIQVRTLPPEQKMDLVINKLRNTVSSALPGNPVSREFDLENQVGSSGPGLLWKLFSANKKSSKEPATVWIFEKKLVDRFSKRERELIIDKLKQGVATLTRLRHPRILSVVHPLEDSRESLCFATEPVFTSLANALGKTKNLTGPQLDRLSDFKFSETELKYGIIQICEALTFLHRDGKRFHLNVSPESIVVNVLGSWKLCGFEFAYDRNDEEWVSTPSWQSSIPSLCQSHLDYCAPEVVLEGKGYAASDMFSVGMLLYTFYNHGISALDCNESYGAYRDLIKKLRPLSPAILSNIPAGIKDYVKMLLQPDVALRPDSHDILKLPFFDDANVACLKSLDDLYQMDNLSRSKFYRNLPNAIKNLPPRINLHRVFPQLSEEFNNKNMVPFVLPSILLIIDMSSREEVTTYILPRFKFVLAINEPIQVVQVLLQNLGILVAKLSPADFKTYALPILNSALESNSTPILVAEVFSMEPSKSIQKPSSALQTQPMSLETKKRAVLEFEQLERMKQQPSLTPLQAAPTPKSKPTDLTDTLIKSNLDLNWSRPTAQPPTFQPMALNPTKPMFGNFISPQQQPNYFVQNPIISSFNGGNALPQRVPNQLPPTSTMYARPQAPSNFIQPAPIWQTTATSNNASNNPPPLSKSDIMDLLR
ncbi:unnamed protein product [Rodentolepis nana]|uniref:Protein kinase domain-containing protein n=1 Tax=Rodentolepis nana TaxID=102285 RepID=A0A0R3TPU9_RODNA|nr:unnamed protein product [Rodentolepis nana]